MDVVGLGVWREELSGGRWGPHMLIMIMMYLLDMYFVDDCMMGMSPCIIMTMYVCVFTRWLFAHVYLYTLTTLIIIVDRLNFGAR